MTFDELFDSSSSASSTPALVRPPAGGAPWARTVVEWVGGRLSTSAGVQVFGCPPRQFAQTPGSSLPRTCEPPGTEHHQRQRECRCSGAHPANPVRETAMCYVCAWVCAPVLLCMWLRTLSRSVPASLPCVRVCRWAGCHIARASKRQGVKAPQARPRRPVSSDADLRQAAAGGYDHDLGRRGPLRP